MSEVIEIGSDGGSTPTRDEESVIELGGNISPILVSDPDDDVPLVDLIEAGENSSLDCVQEEPGFQETPRESPSPDLSATDIVPPEDVVPLSIADEIAAELKKRKTNPKKITSAEVTGWAAHQQIIDLEDGEILDEETNSMDLFGQKSNEASRKVHVLNSKPRNRRKNKKKKKPVEKNTPDWCRSVTVTQKEPAQGEDYGSLLEKYQEVQQKIAESEKHFPAINEDPSCEIIDISSPQREMESDDENDDKLLLELRKRALLSENKSRASRPVKVFSYEYERKDTHPKNNHPNQKTNFHPSLKVKNQPLMPRRFPKKAQNPKLNIPIEPLFTAKNRHKAKNFQQNKWQYKTNEDKWKSIQRTCSAESSNSSEVQWVQAYRDVAIQCGPGEFDDIQVMPMEIDSCDDSSKRIVTFPTATKRNASESEQELRNQLLKQVMAKRGVKIHANPKKLPPDPNLTVISERNRSSSFEQPIFVDVDARPRSESADQAGLHSSISVVEGISPALSAPPATGVPGSSLMTMEIEQKETEQDQKPSQVFEVPQVQDENSMDKSVDSKDTADISQNTAAENEGTISSKAEENEIETTMNTSILETSFTEQGPVVPDLNMNDSLPTSDVLPLHPPVVLNDFSSSEEITSSEEENGIDDEEQARHQIDKLKQSIRNRHAYIVRDRQSIVNYKDLRVKKIEEKKQVKESLEQMMVKVASYERYLRENTEFQRSVKNLVNNMVMDIEKAKRDILEHRLRISELQEQYGLDDAEADENRKIIIRARLNEQKAELERKLKKLTESTQERIDQQIVQQETQLIHGEGTAEPLLITQKVTPTPAIGNEEAELEPLPEMPARVSTPTEPYSLVTKNTFDEKIKSLCTQKISHIKLVAELPQDSDIQQQKALLPRTYLAKDLKTLENKSKFTSPLLKFRSYRFSPYFRESCSIASATYTHKVDCNTPICGYSFSGRCNDDRCVGQHRRDITMQGHEIFLDLLAYNRDIIKMDSFSDYNDQLKVTQAYLNRILPSELVLNISQKCVLLVEEINKESKVDEPHIVSKYTSQGFKCKQNVRKMSKVAKQPEYPEEENQADEFVDDEHVVQQERYFYDEQLERSIKELEEITWNDLKNVSALVELVQKYMSSSILNSPKYALAAICHGLQSNPASPVLWRNFFALHSELNLPVAEDLQFEEVVDFCEDNCTLDRDFWQLRINNSKHKARTIERYIARIIGSEKPEYYFLEFVNAAVYRAFLYSMEPNLSEAADFLSGLPEIIDLPSSFECFIWCVIVHMRIFDAFPMKVLTLEYSCDLSMEVPLTFDFPHESFSIHSPKLTPFTHKTERINKIDVFEEISEGIQRAVSNWDDSEHSENLMTALLEMLVLLDERHAAFAHSIARQLSKCKLVWLLVGSCPGIEPMGLFSEALSKLSNHPKMSYLVARKFIYDDNEELCAFAASIIEDMILPFYETGSELFYENGSISLVSLIRGVLERYYPKHFKDEISETLPKLTTGELTEETVPWIWLSYTLVESALFNPERDLSEIFGVALQVAKQDEEFISLEALSNLMYREDTDSPHLFGFAMKHFVNCPFLKVNTQILPAVLNRLPDSSKMTLCRQLLESPNMSLVESVSWILLDNENYTALTTMLQPLIQSREASANVFAAYLMAEKKLKSRSCNHSMIEFITRFRYSRAAVELSALYWREIDDPTTSNLQLDWLRQSAERQGMKGIFSGH